MKRKQIRQRQNFLLSLHSKKHKGSEQGQGLLEYMILAAFMSVACIGIISILSNTVSAKFAEITHSLRGQKRSVKKDPISKQHYKRKDLGNFMKGSIVDEEHKK